jgi:hypothetical protein
MSSYSNRKMTWKGICAAVVYLSESPTNTHVHIHTRKGGMGSDEPIPHRPLPAVRDLTREGRLSTCDETVLKLSKVSFRGKCYHHQQNLPGWVIFLQLARRAALPTLCSILYLFSG